MTRTQHPPADCCASSHFCMSEAARNDLDDVTEAIAVLAALTSQSRGNDAVKASELAGLLCLINGVAQRVAGELSFHAVHSPTAQR